MVLHISILGNQPQKSYSATLKGIFRGVQVLILFLLPFLSPFGGAGGGLAFSQPPGEWTWMHGDNTPNSPGVFGVQGVPSPTNKPPHLYESCEWKDNNGNFWLFGGMAFGLGEYAALWKYDPNPSSSTYNQWTWMKGPYTVIQPGAYGISGVPSPANYPGARAWGTVSWTDLSGNLWLFGGYGHDGNGGYGLLNDLWKYDVASNQWTWMKGPNAVNNPGFYGTQGVSNPANLPPSRSETSCSWADNTGNLWLYGGNSYGDLWKYDISTNEWTWMHGANTIGPPAVYGTQGVASPANTPGARDVYASWTDLFGSLWLFGGRKYNGINQNDLWKYDIASNQWTWMNGSNVGNDPGNYGTKCVNANSNMPPVRYENRARVRDTCGNFWNFGGGRYPSPPIYFNDLWHYNSLTNQWTWESGDNIPDQTPVYGTIGVSNSGNKPGAKMGSVAWIDNMGYIWIFGGMWGWPGNLKGYNDLFRYVPDPACMLPVVVTASSNTICNGQSTTLTALGGISYSWSPGGQSTSSILVTPTTTTTYTVTGNNVCGSNSASVTILVSSSPTPTITGNTTVCIGQNTTLTSAGGGTYSWNTGATSSSITVSSSGTYSVIASMGNCLAAASVTVTVNPNPIANAASNVTITQGQITTLTASGGGTYLWNNGATDGTITVSPEITTVYCITVTDPNNCIDTACITVTITDDTLNCTNAAEIYLPNAFSPNGDGENDVLQVFYGNVLCVKIIELFIYNRWGEKVFESFDPAFQWDGGYNEKLLNTAVFDYYLKATLLDGKDVIRNGNVSLIR